VTSFYREAVVVGNGDLGADVDLDGELEVAGEVLVARPGDDVGLRAAQGAHLGLADGLAVEAVEPLVDRVLEDGGLADPLVDDRRRDLALAEAGDVDLLGDVAVRVGDAGAELVRGDRNRELDAGRAQLFYRGLHVRGSPVLVGVGAV
jgi:hypothetical protein